MPINNTQFINGLNIGTTNGYGVGASYIPLQDDINYCGVVFTVTSGPTLSAGDTITNGPSQGSGSLIECFFATSPITYTSTTDAVEKLARVATVYRNYLPFSYAGETRTYRTRQVEIDGPNLYVWFVVGATTSAGTLLNAWTTERSAVSAAVIAAS